MYGEEGANRAQQRGASHGHGPFGADVCKNIGLFFPCVSCPKKKPFLVEGTRSSLLYVSCVQSQFYLTVYY